MRTLRYRWQVFTTIVSKKYIELYAKGNNLIIVRVNTDWTSSYVLLKLRVKDLYMIFEKKITCIYP